MKRAALLPFLFLAACAAEAPTVEATASDALSDSKVKLPAGDDCRDVLAPLALGLADSSAGLDYARGVSVSLTSATDTRLYTVAVATDSAFGPYMFEVELDNDSHSKCLLLSAKRNHEAKLESDRKTRMTRAERTVNAPVTVSPANDDCADTVKLLARAAGVSAVGESRIERVTATFEGADENRYYGIHVDGRSFAVDGHTFANDYEFSLETSNDSASKCWVQDFHVGASK